MRRSGLKFLIDTNIFIPLEPTTGGDLEAGTEPATRFLRQIQETGCKVFVHPTTAIDIDRDKNGIRKALRRTLLGKYPPLPDPPALTPRLENVLGPVTADGNDWVDHQLLAAVAAEAV